MARVTKDCPVCGKRQPCAIVATPQGDRESVRYGVQCRVCGHHYAPDADFTVADGQGWADRVRRVHGRLCDPEGHPYPDPGP